MSDWPRIEELSRNMALILLQAGTPPAAHACSAASEAAADDWLRAWIHGPPEFVLPPQADVRRLLLARFRYASALATQARIAGLPAQSPTGGPISLEVLLIDYWYHTARAQWLGGERGVAPQEN